ncbi:MAG: hypothetical protein H6817_04135 [Phycisphaerales bacterium]|nr:hypothetical protein [Phycisphaerales bacterium]
MQVKRVNRLRAAACVALMVITPMLMGGCPEFQNSVVNIANEATQNIILNDADQRTAVETATRGVLSAAIDLFFEQFRNDSSR